MRKATILFLAAGSALLASCGSTGLLDRERPDEFAVQRQAPLVIPPDFDLTPPAPGAPRPTEGTAAQQAMEALFGGPAQRSAAENNTISRAGESEPGIRSAVGDTQTFSVDKGNTTQTIIAAPEGDGQDASVSVPS
ncbi:DUF3035 domain-containing protein [Altererythrobacter xixiisoli]|uniref:DUF3035 domain-containing protein n=1 Tax=Croceibacterium xixiisoli TaxID=1476466 RepID=A0A6I4TW68_9SPHN|nr:DUF3035 domain-containing protein [Croceibacterium xixiisoli]MXP00073.1 DUF3035 domain-containing protein [Croceibacterium xixiisoli]